MNDDTLRRLDQILAMDASDPRRIEALRSVEMRNLLRDYENFLGAEAPVEAGELDRAERHLQAYARSIVAESRPTRSPAPRREAAWRVLAIAASLALVALVGVEVLTPPDRTTVPLLRGDTGTTTGALRLALHRDGSVLVVEFDPIDGADTAELIVLGPDLTERGRIAIAPTPPAHVDLTEYEDGEPLGVRLSIRRGDVELGRSRLWPVPVR